MTGQYLEERKGNLHHRKFWLWVLLYGVSVLDYHTVQKRSESADEILKRDHSRQS